MCINGSVIPEEIIAPDIGKKLVPGKSNVLVFYQIKEEVVLLWCEVNLFAVDSDGSGGYVYFETTKFEGLLCRSRGAFPPGENCVYSGHKLLRAERFNHIVVYAQFKAKKLVIFLSSGGKHNGWDIFYFLNFLAG